MNCKCRRPMFCNYKLDDPNKPWGKAYLVYNELQTSLFISFCWSWSVTDPWLPSLKYSIYIILILSHPLHNSSWKMDKSISSLHNMWFCNLIFYPPGEKSVPSLHFLYPSVHNPQLVAKLKTFWTCTRNNVYLNGESPHPHFPGFLSSIYLPFSSPEPIQSVQREMPLPSYWSNTLVLR